MPLDPLASPAAALNSAERRLVGRESELRNLRAAFEAASNGQPGLVLVAGEPGIGKSALIEQLADLVVRDGGQVLIGHCYATGQPYEPFVDILTMYARGRDPVSLGTQLDTAAVDIARLVPLVRERLNLELRAAADPAEERLRLMRAVSDVLRAVSQLQPLLLVLEDLHDADLASLEVLVHIGRHLGDSRLLVVGTYRDLEVQRAHPLLPAIAELQRTGRFQRIHVRGLSMSAVGDLLASSSHQQIPQPFLQLVYSRTEGNPLYVQEILHFVVDHGLVERRDGALRQIGEESLAGRIPEGLREVVERRALRLSASARQVLSIAAVIGREFRFDILQRVYGQSEDDLERAMEEATGAVMIEERSFAMGAVTYAFRHAFIHQTLYQGVLAPRRMRLHQAVARALEDIDGAHRNEHAVELAEHFALSPDRADLLRAVEYFELAGRQATEVFAHAEAARLLDRAIDLQDSVDPNDLPRRCDLLLSLGESLAAQGEAERVSSAVAPEALRIAEQLADNARVFRACRIAIEALDIQGAATAAARPDYLEWAERARRYA